MSAGRQDSLSCTVMRSSSACRWSCAKTQVKKHPVTDLLRVQYNSNESFSLALAFSHKTHCLSKDGHRCWKQLIFSSPTGTLSPPSQHNHHHNLTSLLCQSDSRLFVDDGYLFTTDFAYPQQSLGPLVDPPVVVVWDHLRKIVFVV